MTLYVLDPVDGHYRFRPANEDDIREAGLVRSGELEILKRQIEGAEATAALHFGARQEAERKSRSCTWCGCANP